MASKVTIEKCNDHDVNIPVNTSNDIYRLKTRSSKNNHYLVIPKDCTIYVQMLENERISFKTKKKSSNNMFLRGPVSEHVESVVA